MRQLLADGDGHRNEEKETSTVRTALLGWPDRARARYGECQRGVKGVETKMVAKFGALRQSGKRARAKQSARRHSEPVDTHASTTG